MLKILVIVIIFTSYKKYEKKSSDFYPQRHNYVYLK